VTQWLPEVGASEEAPEGEPALFHCVHDDGDEEDLEENEVEEALRAFGQLAMERAHWQTAGHQHVGCRIARRFGKRVALAKITKWLPPDEEDDEPALFRAVHDDGDEEDLEEYEVDEARARFEAMPERRATRHS